MADGQCDDHVVQAEEPAFDPGVVGQPRWCVGDNSDVEIAGGHAVVQVRAQARQQVPSYGSGVCEQSPDGFGNDPRGQGGCGADRERPMGRPVTKVAYGTDSAVRLVEGGHGVVPEHLAGRRRTHPARMAFHQRHAELPLQPGDLS
jgi:hypothetical protein